MKAKSKKNQYSIDIDSVHATPTSMDAVVNYLYTGIVNIPKALPEVVDLAVLAHLWGLKRIRWICEEHVRSEVSLQNIHLLLRSTHEAKDETLKLIAIHFAIENWVDILKLNIIQALGPEGPMLFQELAVARESPPAKPERWEEPEEGIINDFKRLYDSKEGVDCNLRIASSDVKLHRALFGAINPACEALLGVRGKDDPLAAVAPASFESLLRYVYYHDDNVHPIAAAELVPLCQTLGLNSFRQICEHRIRNNINKDTVLDILNVAYLPSMHDRADLRQELKEKAFNFIVNEITSVELGPLR
jgi:hypothetical protein